MRIVPAMLALLAVASLSACGSPAGSTTGEGASCAAPRLTVAPTAIAPGQPLEVRGSLLLDSCQDTVADGSVPPPPAPLSDLSVVLVQGTRHWTLAEGLTAEDDGTLQVTVSVPDDPRLADGTAMLGLADVALPVPVTVAR